ncbi:MAG: hypothetical protein BM558_11350 [Roseobacter sp. MedPE-SW]|nr:MAG: hypothetical protein BM558_11350 [Roseobacter sp. MedPE-SW]
MAGTGVTGGLSGMALGGAVATVVVIGGATMAWLGVFDGSEGDRATREGAANTVAISPSANPPVVIEGVSQEPDPVVADSEAVEAQAAPAQTEQQVSGSEEPAITVTETQAAPDPAGESAVAETETEGATDVAQLAGETDLADTAQAEAETETVAATATAVQQSAVSDATEGTQANGSAETDSPAQVAEAQVDEDPAVETQTPEGPATEELVQEEPTGEQVAEVPLFEAPLLDLVRVGPTGETVIAGRATAGVLVEVLLDGAPIEQVEVQSGGDFVAFADLPPSRQPRVISLRASAQGQDRLSDSSFIVAPANSTPAPSASDATDQIALATDGQASEEASSDDVAQSVEAAGDAASEATSDAASTAVASGATEQANAEQSIQSEDAATDAETGLSETETAQVAKATPETEPQTPAAKVPQGVATQGPDSTAPAAVVAAPETTLTADASTAVAQPDATNPGEAEETTEVETNPAPQPEPTQVAVLRADAEGVTLVQPIAQKPQGKVVLDTISYSDSGEVELAGRAGAASKVLVYLDNAPAGQFTAAQNGSWGGRLEGVTPGVYTLRLDEVNDSGKVLSRLETPFKREAPEVLQPPASEGTAGEAVPLVQAVTVQEGDTLWAISQQRYGSGFLYVRVFEANQSSIRDPDLIYPGQVFALPE